MDGQLTCTDTEGVVHGIMPLQGEHTLCGDAFNAGDVEPDSIYWTADRKPKRITCIDCAVVIDACRKMRVDRTAN